jgi:hypothetical protein
VQDLTVVLDTAVRDTLAHLRSVDPDAAADLAELRRAHLTRPGVVVVGETKRGKSSLINALLGVPGLSPVDAAVTTAAYIDFVPGDAVTMRAWLPGGEEIEIDDLDEWATGRQRARRIEVTHPAPLLRYLSLLDTPGAGGLDPAHATIALAAVRRATALLFVADASAPLSRPELDFLAAATERVDAVVFALTKIDAYPQWRAIAEDNRELLQAHAPRFANAPWFPVSARLAELSLSAMPDLIDDSRIPPLQHALVELAGRGHQLRLANVLRAARGDLARLQENAEARLSAATTGAAGPAEARAERNALAARKRTESRQATLRLSTEIQRARVATVGHLRTRIGEIQHELAERIDKTGIDGLPDDVDTRLQAVAADVSERLEDTSRQIAEQILVDTDRATVALRHTVSTTPPRGGTGDNVLIAISAGGIALVAGRAGALGVAALGGAGGLLLPFAGIGLGLAAGGYVLWRRKVHQDRRQAHTWLRDVLAEARAALSDEISQRFTDLQFSLSVALDDSIERRLKEIDAQIAEIDAAAAEDAAGRARRRAAAQRERDAATTRLRQADEALLRARALTPTPIDDDRER